MKKQSLFIVLLLAVVFAVTGCGKKADANKPIDQVRAEAGKMSAADLESTAKAYADAIISKRSEVEQIEGRLKTLSPQELFGDRAKTVRDQASALSGEVSALSERYSIYVERSQAQGGDPSNVQIR